MNQKQILNQSLLQDASSLLIVTALCGAGGALTTTANAAVTATPGISPATPLLLPNSTNGMYINAVTGGASPLVGSVPGWDLNPFSWTSGNPGGLTFNTDAPNGMTDLAGGSSGPSNLPPGAIVEATNSFVLGLTPAVFGATPGDWTLNSTNYFGFTFLNEAGGTTHYGYGSILVVGDPTNRFLTGLFYESIPNTGITVVPEPTSAFLAAGAAGLLTLRRRRLAA